MPIRPLFFYLMAKSKKTVNTEGKMCKTNNPINRGFIPIQIYALLFVYLAFVNTKCKREAYYIECEMTTMLLLYIPSSFSRVYRIYHCASVLHANFLSHQQTNNVALHAILFPPGND